MVSEKCRVAKRYSGNTQCSTARDSTQSDSSLHDHNPRRDRHSPRHPDYSSMLPRRQRFSILDAISPSSRQNIFPYPVYRLVHIKSDEGISISLKSHHDNMPKNMVCRLKSVNFCCKPFKSPQVTIVALDDFQFFRAKFPDFSST